ncbi:Reverse transcriptase zinc-binding domain [Macleaya cordata]|uniref:Reverse transcriptase zinc-binding domain n=1 Tax=Macleaya cordata TaxID=56857 RepID=A0A200PT79_MACCD|nr:Reverse transcriptase zinc-binding domain [Macleaya cordata]
MWRLISNALPLRSNIGRHIKGFDRTCILCGLSEEDNDHLFLKCSVVKNFWFYSPLGVRCDVFGSVTELIDSWVSHNEEAYKLGACLIWNFWKARNRKYFDNEDMCFTKINKAALRCLNDYSSNFLEEGTIELEIINSASTSSYTFQWVPPPRGVKKINVDAAFKDNKFAVAAVARDSMGSFLGCITVIGITDSVETVELHALILGLKFSSRFDNNPCWLEGDSLKVISWVNDSSSKPPWRLENQVFEARSIITNSNTQCVSFVRRSCNSVADLLAHFAFQYSVEDVWV